MKLQLDSGNSYIKWRLMDAQNNLLQRGEKALGGEIISFFKEAEFLHKIRFLQISNVSNHELEGDICSLFEEKVPECKIFRACSKPRMSGVKFIYDDVTRLGVDRCLAMIAAYNKKNKGVLVIDCGSAMTADIVQDSGNHMGGYIFPGFNLLKRSLLSGTSRVLVEFDVVESYGLGKNTEECVWNGVHLMMRSTLQGLVELAKQYKVYDLVLTGGDGALALSLIDGVGEYDSDLVFKGLNLASLV